MAKVLMIVAQQGFRDEELLIPKEIVEGEGHKVKVASVARGKATGALGTVVNAEMSVHEANPEFFDAIVVVGGPGSHVLATNQDMMTLLKRAAALNRIVGAICIAPMALANAGVLEGKKATVFETSESIMALKKGGANIQKVPVVQDGKLLTANGPAAAGEFGKKLNEMLKA
jgi:protease I